MIGTYSTELRHSLYIFLNDLKIVTASLMFFTRAIHIFLQCIIACE